MICPTCDRENPVDATFCMGCATRLGEKAEAPTFHSINFPSTSGFVGRQREMGQLTSALEGVQAGRGRLVMLAGEPGIGKTRIAQELATYAESRGFQVLWGRCYEGEGAPPYWLWVQVIRAFVAERDPEQLWSEIGSGASHIAEVVSEVRERLPAVPLPPTFESPEQARFQLFDSIARTLKSASIAQPLLLVLDDLHWSDLPSLLLLQFLAPELGDSRLLILGTYRDVELSRQHPLAETLGELTRERLFQRILLRGLHLDDVARFIEATTGTTPSQAILQPVYAQTEGNPLFLTEVVRLLAQESGLTSPSSGEAEPWAARIPEGVREVIGRRLNRLSPECNQTLTLASVIGREFSLNQLAALVEDMSEDRLILVLEEALASRVIEELPQAIGHYHFSHALIQETLAAELTATRRVRLHARVAEVLEQLYERDLESHAAELAYHFSRAAVVLGPDKLIKYSLLAGERAMTSYAYEEAVDYFERALAEKAGQAMDYDTAELRFGLARAQVATSNMVRARGAIQGLSEAFDYYVESGEVERAIRIADFPFVIIGNSPLVAMVDMASRALELVPPESLQAGRLLDRYGLALGSIDANYHKAKEAFSQALVIARREGDLRLEARVLVDSCRLDGFNLLPWEYILEQSRQAIDLMDRVDDPGSEVPARYWAANALMVQGDLAQARVQADAMLAPAEEAHHRSLMIIAFWTKVPVARMQGDWDSARKALDQGITLSPQQAALLGPKALVEYEVGDFPLGESYLNRMIEAEDTPNNELFYRAVIIPLAARITGRNDRLEVAKRSAEALITSEAAGTNLYIAATRTGLGLVAVLQGDATAAREQYLALEGKRAAEWFGIMSTDRLLALLAYTMGDTNQAFSHFEDALAFCGGGYRPELAWTCCDYAEGLLQRNNPGDHERAVSLLDEALTLSTELGMSPLIERVRRFQEESTRQPTISPPYPDGLTQREVEVLRLIASGKNNREIAGELVVSVGTVANHVTSILNKANLSNRTEAAGYAIRQGLA